MNCDEAFEHLTDRHLHQSEALRRHLSGCPRCRHMQETMAPALGHFAATARGGSEHDASRSILEPSDSRDADHGAFLSVEAVEVAERAARQLWCRRPNPILSRTSLVSSALRYVAVFCIGGLAVFGAMGRGPLDRDPSDVPAVPGAPAAIQAACTRQEVGQVDFTRPERDARNVVLTCVACHLAAPAARENQAAMNHVGAKRDLAGSRAQIEALMQQSELGFGLMPARAFERTPLIAAAWLLPSEHSA